LQDFKKAGIKTWMLTGDKGETAKQIGQLCGMLWCQGGDQKNPPVFKRLSQEGSEFNV
jgi:P-type E1-E2 ATPase